MFSETDQKFMLEALKEAHLAFECGEIPVGAIITKDGRIIGRGHNVVAMTNDISGHAEINAIKDASKTLNDWRLTDCTIYITLEPCYMCQGAIYLSRIKRIVYATSYHKEFLYGSNDLFLSPKLAYYPIVESGLLKEKSETILKHYFKNIRNIS